MTNCKKQNVYVGAGLTLLCEDLAFRLHGKAAWEHVEVFNDELRNAPIGTTWSASDWYCTETATIIGKHFDGVSCKVKVRFDTESAYENGVNETVVWTYIV